MQDKHALEFHEEYFNHLSHLTVENMQHLFGEKNMHLKFNISPKYCQEKSSSLEFTFIAIFNLLNFMNLS